MPLAILITMFRNGLTAVSHRLRSQRGASMVEYALLVVLIAIVAILAVTLAGKELSENYSSIASGLEYANNVSN